MSGFKVGDIAFFIESPDYNKSFHGLECELLGRAYRSDFGNGWEVSVCGRTSVHPSGNYFALERWFRKKQDPSQSSQESRERHIRGCRESFDDMLKVIGREEPLEETMKRVHENLSSYTGRG